METLEERKERELLGLDTIEALRNAGSNLLKTHYIEHHFVVKNEWNISEIYGHFKRYGYEISEESKKMNEIALLFGKFYDGWGTSIVE